MSAPSPEQHPTRDQQSCLVPLEEAHAEASTVLFRAIGMVAPETPVEQQRSFIRGCRGPGMGGRVLVIDGTLVGGGQLTIGKRPRAAELGMWVHPA